MHFDTVLDWGYDYGADGGQAWETEVATYPNSRTIRNQNRTTPAGTWQLGNRVVDEIAYFYLQSFVHAMRGQLHSFLYKDWNDYKAEDEVLQNAGAATLQLTKGYGLAINPFYRTILKPAPGQVALELNTGGGYTPLFVDTDYTLDDETGLITWINVPAPSSLVRWTGEFYVPARFDRDVLTAQFLGLEEIGGTEKRAYELGALGIVEDFDA